MYGHPVTNRVSAGPSGDADDEQVSGRWAVPVVLSPPESLDEEFAVSTDLERMDGKLDSIVERLGTIGDRLTRLEERAGTTATGLESHRSDVQGDVRAFRDELRGLQARASALELAKAAADGSMRTYALVWGVVVAAPGLIVFIKSLLA